MVVVAHERTAEGAGDVAEIERVSVAASERHAPIAAAETV
jgi:hypothetical protein